MSVIDEVNAEAVGELVPFSEATVQPIMTLAEGGVLSYTSLALPDDLSYESYENIGNALGAFDRACKWWVGDWLMAGEGVFPDRYPQAARHTGLSEQTLLNRVTVCRAVPAERRRPLVGYSCHALIAPLNGREQSKWLLYAEENNSTVAELRAAMKRTTPPITETVPTTDVGTSGEVDTQLLLEVAISIVKNCEVAGENVIIRVEDYRRLLAALGEEEL